MDLREQLQQSLGDAYVVERELAPGGMSRLFLATESSLERKVVIKLLPPETASEVSASRFQREALVAAGLQHPNILPVLATGNSNGVFYYIMPYVAGESLRHRLQRGVPFSVPEALRIVREIADALALAHARGIVHRDIKPANILLQEGHAVVTDFGIARAVEASRRGPADATAERLTETGVAIGTVGYMAPEQLAGERDLDARADVYALAVVAYEMLAGRPPFSGRTAQALVAAHLSESPPPLASISPDVPPAISLVIDRALAKAPEDRYRSAAEFRDALDVPVTAAFRDARAARAPRNMWIGGLALVVAAALALGLFVRSRASTLDPDYVVVLPFNVLNADPAMHEGMMDLLSEGMNGQGWVKTVPPSRYARTWTDNADEATAARLGKRMGAALAVFGSVAATGGDSLALSASVMDVAHGRVLGSRHERTGPKRNLSALANDLARDLLEELNDWKTIGAFRSTWLQGTSLAALQPFLIGEQFYRRSAWDSAVAYYDRAIEADSTFGLAYRHAGLVIGWRRSAQDSLSRTMLLKGSRYNRGLPRRDSILLAADSLRASLTAFETDTAYVASVRSLFRVLRTARDSFPTDPEVWFALGDAYFHYADGPGLSVPNDTILAAFDRSIALDSGFTPAYIHPIEMRLARDGREAGLHYAERYLALHPTDEEADGIRVLALLLRGSGGRTATILDTLSADALQTTWLIARRWTDSAEFAVRLLELPIRGRQAGSAFIADPGYHRLLLASELAYRGRLARAYETLGTNIGPTEQDLFGTLAVMGGVPADTANEIFHRELNDRSVWFTAAPAWWAAHADTASLVAAGARANRELATARTAVRRRNWTYRTSAVRAYLSLARHDPNALAEFERLPDSLCLSCYVDRYTKARLLDSVGRGAEAEAALGERPHTLLTPLEVLVARQRAVIGERLRDYDVAARAYEIVAGAWSPGDDKERAQAAQAAAKASQLGGDRGRHAFRSEVIGSRSGD